MIIVRLLFMCNNSWIWLVKPKFWPWFYLVHKVVSVKSLKFWVDVLHILNRWLLSHKCYHSNYCFTLRYAFDLLPNSLYPNAVLTSGTIGIDKVIVISISSWYFVCTLYSVKWEWRIYVQAFYQFMYSNHTLYKSHPSAEVLHLHHNG